MRQTLRLALAAAALVFAPPVSVFAAVGAVQASDENPVAEAAALADARRSAAAALQASAEAYAPDDPALAALFGDLAEACERDADALQRAQTASEAQAALDRAARLTPQRLALERAMDRESAGAFMMNNAERDRHDAALLALGRLD